MSLTEHPNVRAAMEEEGPVGEVPDATEQWVSERIIHILSIYPKLGVSMLQVGMGTSLAPKIWKPTLQKMIRDGVILQNSVPATTPDGRSQAYTVLSLAPNRSAPTAA